MGSDRIQVVTAAALVSVVTVSVVAAAFAGGVTAAASDGAPPGEEVFEVSESVDAWERAAFPLRADDEDAAYTVRNADWRARMAAGEVSLNRDPIPVFEAGDEVSVAFDSQRAMVSDDYFAGERVQIVRAHVDESGDDQVPQSTDEALELLSTGSASENATFTATTPERVGPDGDLDDHEASPPAGHSFYFAVTTENGSEGVVTNDAGEFTGIDGEITVVGVERVVARSSAGAVDAPKSVEAGETASFDVDAADLDAAERDERITQGVVVYDEDTYADQSFVLEREGELDDEFDVREDAAFYADVDSVNGVARADETATVFGRQVGDGRVGRSTGIGGLFDLVGDQVGTDAPGVRDGTPEERVVLHGSSTLVTGQEHDRTVDVETLGNWSEGEYRWVYVAVGADSGDLATQSGTLTVGDDASDPDDSDPDDGDTDDGASDDDPGDDDSDDDRDESDSDDDDSDDGDAGDGDETEESDSDGDESDAGGDDSDDSDAGGSDDADDADDSDDADDETETETESDDDGGGAVPPEDSDGGIPVGPVGAVVLVAGGGAAFYLFWLK